MVRGGRRAAAWAALGALLRGAGAISLLQEEPPNATAPRNNGVKAATFMYNFLRLGAKGGLEHVDLCSWNTWAPPTLCSAGEEPWSRAEIREAVPEFAQLYESRPIARNVWGMNANHAFALWYIVRALKFKHIIESGVFRGHGTWLMRAAAGPDAKIYSLDPLSHTALDYHDKSPNTQYLMGHLFKDLKDVEWDGLIPAEERDSTLVVLDDHQAATSRVRDLTAHGFRHLFYDDNYKTCSDCYSFNSVCSPVKSGDEAVLFVDQNGQYQRKLSMDEQAANLKFLQERMETYFEFPPLLDGCHWGNDTILSGESELASFRLPSMDQDPYKYATARPPYVKLRK